MKGLEEGEREMKRKEKGRYAPATAVLMPRVRRISESIKKYSTFYNHRNISLLYKPSEGNKKESEYRGEYNDARGGVHVEELAEIEHQRSKLSPEVIYEGLQSVGHRCITVLDRTELPWEI